MLGHWLSPAVLWLPWASSLNFTLLPNPERRGSTRAGQTLSLLLGKPHEVAAGLVGPSWDWPSSQQGRA